MASDSIEQRLSRLEKSNEVLIKKNEQLAHEVMRLQAINEIQNVMGRYQVTHTPSTYQKSWELWAQHTPGTWIEISEKGKTEGIDEIKRMWLEAGKTDTGEKEKVGVMMHHDLATPIIEVAKDGKTAKALWSSPGHETFAPGGKPRASWAWGKYAVDFVKEDGEWKIWHFKWFRIFITPFDKSWTEKREPPIGFTARKIEKPSAYHKPYTTDLIQEAIPPAPRPYETWTEKDEDWHLLPSERP